MSIKKIVVRCVVCAVLSLGVFSNISSSDNLGGFGTCFPAPPWCTFGDTSSDSKITFIA